jgi:hypothetical protein
MTDAALIPLHDPAQPAVTLITALTATGDLSADEYRAIYDQVAAGRSLRNIELALQSAVTYGWWASYAKGDKRLDRDRKNELRRWSRANGGPDLPDLPPTPVEAVAAHVHPDAAVYYVGTTVGEQIASRVILVGIDVPTANLRINGAVTVTSDALTPQSHQPTCNSRYTHKPRASIHLSHDTWNRLNAARLRAGLTWDAFLARLEE